MLIMLCKRTKIIKIGTSLMKRLEILEGWGKIECEFVDVYILSPNDLKQ